MVILSLQFSLVKLLVFKLLESNKTNGKVNPTLEIANQNVHIGEDVQHTTPIVIEPTLKENNLGYVIV